MFKKVFVGILVTLVLVAGIVGAYKSSQAAVSKDDALVQARVNGVDNNSGYRGGQEFNPVVQPQADEQVRQLQTGEHELAAPSELSEIETEGLLWMREEEKLARDVYTALYDAWGLPIFQNIASSEQAHMDAIKVLLDSYELVDPLQEQAGVFSDPDLQGLYDELVVQGSRSIADALKVGATIEEIDILDLQSHLAQTDNLDIQQVYNNLLRGSENHLRSFTNTLMSQTGETYQPQYLSLEQYQLIVNQSSSRGNGNGNYGQGDGQGGGAGRGRRGGNL